MIERAPVMALAVMALLVMAACPRVPPVIETPHVNVGEVAAVLDTSADLVIRIGLRVMNPNDFACAARAMDWELAIGNAGSRRGRVALDQTIPARSSSIVEVTINIPAAAAAAMVARMESNARSYRLSGTLHLTSERRDIGAVFDGRGDLGNE